MLIKLSPHLSYKEAVRSYMAERLGIDNTPNEQQLTNMKLLAEKVFEPVRKYFKKSIYVHSMFRSPEVNQLIGGADTSQHLEGRAIDIDADIFGGMTNRDMFDYIRKNLEFDQLILENIQPDGNGGWVHISYKEGENRKEVLTMENRGGLIIYRKFVEDDT